MQSIFRTLADLWQRKLAGRQASRQQRKLFFEPMEARAVMAADNLGAIAGTVYSDATGNGFTNDDQPIVGAQVQLYRDGGNGTFDNGSGDDSLVTTQTTGAGGKYQFNGLTAGTYHVRQPVTAGYLQKPNTNAATITISAADAAGAVGDVIDSFDSNQEIELRGSGPTSGAGVSLSNSVLGGERDLAATMTSSSGRIIFSSNVTSPSRLEFSTTLTADGVGTVTWDGVDNNATGLNASGLNNYDLTKGGTISGLQLSLSADPNNARGTIRIYKDASNYSKYEFALPGGGANIIQNVYIPLSAFQTVSGTGADFTKVGAIQLELTGIAAIDGSADQLTTVGPKVATANFPNFDPLCLGDLVFTDTNNNGQFDAATERGVGSVLVNLYSDTDNNGSYTAGVDQKLGSQTTDANGLYKFRDLLPGSYIVQVDPVNFTSGRALNGYKSSTPAVTDPDNDLNNDDNGDSVTAAGVFASAVTLAANTEPTNDGDGNDGNLSVDFGFCPPIDLQLTKTDSPDPVVPGGELTYTIVVRNNGPITATGVTVTDPLPSQVTYKNATSTRGNVTFANGTVTANLGTMNVNDTATVTVVVTVKADTRGTFENEASVIGNEFETNMTNNRDKVPTSVDPKIDLAIDKSDSPDPVSAGGDLTYTLLIRNNGPTNATGVVVTDVLPDHLTLKTVTPAKGTNSVAGKTITINVGNLAVNEQTLVTIVTTVDPFFSGTIVNHSNVRGNEIETTYTNNQDDEPTLVNPIISSLAGCVYVDSDDDGILDLGEQRLSNTTVRLTGSNYLGQAIDRVMQTDVNGCYLFSSLLPGNYNVQETQPTGYLDGKDTRGTPLLGTTSNDLFSSIALPGNTNAVDYNFGERPIPTTPEGDPDPDPPFSKRRYIRASNW